ncbi:TetR family transcriptional regulator [Nocardioides aromaticivorans]|uniref:TetR family transcriptional regulator n=1 Tax=Nocardioides aromaticivorans TaxID=200618 RepID=A0ABX7PIX2_9ACTN|nr:TetR family transcriptional regulator [Nocardioides aromaticivorans]
MPYGCGVTKTSSPDRPAPPDERQLRPAGRATRAAIEEAARRLFAERGFDASVRAIAHEAGVDPALVIRHFGSKEALFLRCVDTSTGIGTVLDGPLETVGRRLVAYFLEPGRPLLRQRYLALAQAAHLDQVREEMNRHTAETYVAALAPQLTGPDRELRVALAVAQLGGLLNLVFRQEDPLVTAADTDRVVALYGDAIQHLLTPDAAEGP